MALAPSVEGSSLYLLRAIEQTVDSLQVEEQLAQALAAVTGQLSREIRTAEVVTGAYLDPDDAAINKIEAGYRAIEEYLPRLLLKKSSVDQDGRLEADQCDLLHTAYDRCISSLAALIESCKDLRAAVITYDLAAEPTPSESFDSAESLIESLHARET